MSDAERQASDPQAPDPQAENLWQRACLAMALFAVAPFPLGGVSLRARSGPVRERWLSGLTDLVRPLSSLHKLPTGITDDRLLGGLDLAATLKSGKPLAQRGLLAEADGGILLLAMAERLPAVTAAHVAGALDRGAVLLERDGLTDRLPARFGAVALDEGIEDDEAAPPALLERLAFHLDLTGLSLRDLSPFEVTSEAIQDARDLYRQIPTDEAVLNGLCEAAVALGIASLRAPKFALEAARAAAALDGRPVMDQDDAALAAGLVLAPRATVLPAPPDEAMDEQEPSPPDDSPTEKEETPPEPEPEKALDDLIVEAALAAIPDDLLARLRLGQAMKSRSAATGKAGAMAKALRRGRPAGIRRGELKSGARLNVVETLRAAAPWQPLRRRTAGNTDRAARVSVQAEDFRITRFKHATETTTIFVVDASGSSALNRLGEAKGAVELLLADCYVRRDQVALIAFRGQEAEILLPPTRSLLRAKRSLAGLPGGGGTPLAAAFDAAFALSDAIKRRGQTPVLIFMTDGRANIARDGTADRRQAMEDATASARVIRASGIASIFVDTAPRARPDTEQLARELGAHYLALPRADAATLSGVARDLATASH